MKYLKYLWYVIRHKWFVMLECFKMGLIWEGLVHDNSKFLPDEFFPYAEHFYGKKAKGIKTGRDKTGYYKPYDTGDKAFDFAWFLHQKRNKHHWQWWILPIEPLQIWKIGNGKEIMTQADVDKFEKALREAMAKPQMVLAHQPSYEIELFPSVTALEMPIKYVKEMIADWKGAGRAQGIPDTKAWYEKNGKKMNVNLKTRQLIELLLHEEIK